MWIYTGTSHQKIYLQATLQSQKPTYLRIQSTSVGMSHSYCNPSSSNYMVSTDTLLESRMGPGLTLLHSSGRSKLYKFKNLANEEAIFKCNRNQDPLKILDTLRKTSMAFSQSLGEPPWSSYFTMLDSSLENQGRVSYFHQTTTELRWSLWMANLPFSEIEKQDYWYEANQRVNQPNMKTLFSCTKENVLLTDRNFPIMQ